MDNKGAIQEAEYVFPYHHIPALLPTISQTRSFSWGYEYLSYLELVLETLAAFSFDSLADIGCGDGRFTLEIARRFPSARVVGLDYSEKSLGFARAFSPSLTFATHTDERFDAFLLIEVLEHIDPSHMREFLDGICLNLKPGARGVLTTPSTNVKTHSKHYQHFDEPLLRRTLGDHFMVESVEYLNAQAPEVRRMNRFMTNRFFAVTHGGFLSWFYGRYKKRYLHASESTGGRLMAQLRVK